MPIRKAPRCVQHRRGLIEGGECNASLLPNSEGIVALSESRVNSKTHNLKKRSIGGRPMLLSPRALVASDDYEIKYIFNDLQGNSE